MKKLALVLLAWFAPAMALDSLIIANTYIDSQVLTHTNLNDDNDSAERWSQRLVDSIDTRWVRFADLESGDSTLSRLQVDTIRGNPSVDSLDGPIYVDTIRGNPNIDSIGGPVYVDSMTVDSMNVANFGASISTLIRANVDSIRGNPATDSIAGPTYIDTLTVDTLGVTNLGAANWVLTTVDADTIKNTGAALSVVGLVEMDSVSGNPDIDSAQIGVITGSDEISGNPTVDSLSGLDVLTGNPDIDSAQIGVISGANTITGNPSADSLVVSDIMNVTGRLTVDTVTGLDYVRGNPDIDSAQIGVITGADEISGNPDIDSIAGPTYIDTLAGPTIMTGVAQMDTIRGVFGAGIFCSDTLRANTLSLGTNIETETVISNNALEVASSYVYVDTEGDAALDTIATITSTQSPQILILHTVSSDRDVFFDDSFGNMVLSGDFTLTGMYDTITLISWGSSWMEISRSDNH